MLLTGYIGGSEILAASTFTRCTYVFAIRSSEGVQNWLIKGEIGKGKVSFFVFERKQRNVWNLALLACKSSSPSILTKTFSGW